MFAYGMSLGSSLGERRDVDDILGLLVTMTWVDDHTRKLLLNVIDMVGTWTIVLLGLPGVWTQKREEQSHPAVYLSGRSAGSTLAQKPYE